MIRVIFVCLGNICRSPMAEAIFSDLVKKANLSQQFEVASVGTSSYHVGDLACRGTRQVLAKHNIVYKGRSKQITQRDLSYFDYIVAMDSGNLSDLVYLDQKETNQHKFHKLLDFASLTTITELEGGGKWDFP